MFCKKCGNEIGVKMKFCTKCGEPIEQVKKGKSINKNRKKVICCICIIAFVVMAGAASAFLFNGEEKVSVGTGNISLDNDEANQYILENFGFADNPVYGEKITHTEVGNGSRRTTYDTRFNENSKGGSIFYRTVKTEKYPSGLVCVYLADDENGGIALNTTYVYDYKSDGSSHTTTIAMPKIKNRCYAIIHDDYFVTVEFSEEESISDADKLIYEETITAYNLNNDLEQEFEIRREINPDDDAEKKQYHIREGNSNWLYAYGYNNTTFTGEGLKFISTEQEFCDKANELLHNISINNCVQFNKSSWNNRWYGTVIDESGIGKDMVKVDFITSPPVTDTNSDEVSDIIITTNAEKQELAEGEQLEEIEDNPITYKHSTEKPKDEIVMPQNIPTSIDKTSLQDLRYFDIDGFWHSDDLRYVYHIYASNPDNGFGTLYFTDLKYGGKAKHGQVKQTSNYSVILKAMENNGFSPEVFAVNNQLKSDQITLIRANTSIANQLLGDWSNGETTYTFDSEGKYKVKRGNDWYWGYYFIIDEDNIVLGKQSDDCKINHYSMNGNNLTINNSLALQKR